MPVTATVLFDTPQSQIATLIEGKLASSTATSIVSGFITVEGMKALESPLRANPKAVREIVVGAGTYRAYEAFDDLLAARVPIDRLFVHLGHTRLTSSASARHRFYRYHPMLHSKVYYTEHANGMASAFIGSHNVTAFALLGLNGEAAVLLEGPIASAQFAAIRSHIAVARAQSVQYSPGMKEAFSWWTTQFIEGLRDKANDVPRVGEAKKTIVILAECPGTRTPQKDEVLYFELPAALGHLKSLQADIHLYLFDTLPATPWEALQSLSSAKASCWCRARGLEMEQGGVELRVNWHIDDNRRPVIRPAAQPFRPTPTPDMQQVRAQVWNAVYDEFEYLFEPPAAKWVPRLSRESSVQVPLDRQELLAGLDLVPRETRSGHW